MKILFVCITRFVNIAQFLRTAILSNSRDLNVGFIDVGCWL